MVTLFPDVNQALSSCTIVPMMFKSPLVAVRCVFPAVMVDPAIVISFEKIGSLGFFEFCLYFWTCQVRRKACRSALPCYSRSTTHSQPASI